MNENRPSNFSQLYYKDYTFLSVSVYFASVRLYVKNRGFRFTSQLHFVSRHEYNSFLSNGKNDHLNCLKGLKKMNG